MKTIFRKVLAILISVIILCGAFSSTGAFATASAQDVTVLFTHDLHSHLLPSADTDGSIYGGYARLSTAIAEQKKLHPNALLLDGGDFAMGSLFQTAFATSAIELRMMGQMGYDVTTFGNHEFDYGFDNGWEAEFVEGDDRSAQLYAVSEIGKMAFLAQPELDGTLLGFAPSRDGAEYTFSFYYTGSQKLYLNDLKLQTSTLVSDNDTYLFTYEKGDEQRFIISTAPFNIPDLSTGVGNTTNGENAKAVKFIKDDKIFIFVNGMLYDATGKIVIR